MDALALAEIPYCGTAPAPDDWWQRWNADPVLIGGLAALALACACTAHSTRRRSLLGGCATLALAWLTPLCALGVALFSARVAQHLLLALVAAPLFALGFPQRRAREVPGSQAAVLSAWIAFAMAFWAWHLPGPYDATLRSDFSYWASHTSIAASALWLWRVLLDRRRPLASLLASLTTSAHLGLLGALLTFAPTPLFASHQASAPAWGLAALEDQQLGGLLCWTLGCGAFLIAGLASTSRALGDNGLRPRAAIAAGADG